VFNVGGADGGVGMAAKIPLIAINSEPRRKSVFLDGNINNIPFIK